MDWARWKEIALGVLGWPPDVFWQSTFAELFPAIDGWREKNGTDGDKGPPAGRDDLEAMKQKAKAIWG